jgi:hypothetical protein
MSPVLLTSSSDIKIFYNCNKVSIAKLMGVEIEILSDKERFRPEKSEVERLWASNEKAYKLLGWKPEYDGLDGFGEGLAKTVAWFKDPVNLSSYKSNIYNI